MSNLPGYVVVRGADLKAAAQAHYEMWKIRKPASEKAQAEWVEVVWEKYAPKSAFWRAVSEFFTYHVPKKDLVYASRDWHLRYDPNLAVLGGGPAPCEWDDRTGIEWMHRSRNLDADAEVLVEVDDWRELQSVKDWTP